MGREPQPQPQHQQPLDASPATAPVAADEPDAGCRPGVAAWRSSGGLEKRPTQNSAASALDFYPGAATSELTLLIKVQDLRFMSLVNVFLALVCVLYLGSAITCMILNSFDLEEEEAVTTPSVFHGIEFWSTFCFNVAGALALVYSPNQSARRQVSSALLKPVMISNVTGSFVAALLVSINVERFEFLAHQIEYTVELTMGLMDVLVVAALVKRARGSSKWDMAAGYISLAAVAFGLAVAMAQLLLYNFAQEQLAHVFEFSFDIVSSLITFCYTVDSKFAADERVAVALGEAPADGEGGKSDNCMGPFNSL